jgi:hypothetical protein
VSFDLFDSFIDRFIMSFDLLIHLSCYLIRFSQMPKKKTSTSKKNNRHSGTLTIGVASDALTPAEREAAREAAEYAAAQAAGLIVSYNFTNYLVYLFYVKCLINFIILL